MILVVFGTRPEALKLAECTRLAKSRGLNVHVHCTMQSPDLVDQAILPWDTQGRGETPIGCSLVVVQGDTRTAFQAAVNAYELGIPVFHLEAGVRSGNNASPHPEEGYRKAITAVATYHACTTQQCLENLDLLNITEARVTGSPIVQSIMERLEVQDSKGPTIGPRVLVTLHRRENRGRFGVLWEGLGKALGLNANVVWPTHPNGWAFAEAPEWAKGWASEPMESAAFARLLDNSDLVVTDSGGVNEESAILGVPCCLFRTATDRPECLLTFNRRGNTILAGDTSDEVARAIHAALSIERDKIDRTVYGDMTAASNVVDWWSEILGVA